MPLRTALFIDAQGHGVTVTQVRTTLYGLQCIIAVVQLRSLNTLPPALPWTARLLPQAELLVHSCRQDMYFTPIPTKLPTMVAPVGKHGVFPSQSSAYHSKIEREATSEQLVTLAVSSAVTTVTLHATLRAFFPVIW
ncbi:hypothetical protein MTO96_021760 [Rhipicephalus appendiculatus]